MNLLTKPKQTDLKIQVTVTKGGGAGRDGWGWGRATGTCSAAQGALLNIPDDLCGERIARRTESLCRSAEMITTLRRLRRSETSERDGANSRPWKGRSPIPPPRRPAAQGWCGLWLDPFPTLSSRYPYKSRMSLRLQSQRQVWDTAAELCRRLVPEESTAMRMHTGPTIHARRPDGTGRPLCPARWLPAARPRDRRTHWRRRTPQRETQHGGHRLTHHVWLVLI